MKRAWQILIRLVFTLFIGFVGFVIWVLYPHENRQPLPDPLVASMSEEGLTRLAEAEASADYPKLLDAFAAQSLGSYCGVATGVTVLEAFGRETDQWDFFTSDASKIRSRFQVTFGGMSLPDLESLFNAHGVTANKTHAADTSVDGFRAALNRNLVNSDDFLIVNYQRELLGQGEVGHISPLAAYDADTDSVLILDTAAHKWPHTWVPVEMLFAAMSAVDPATGKSRGYLEVSQ